MQINKNQRFCPTSSEPRHEKHAAIKDHNKAKSTAPFSLPSQTNSEVTLQHFNVYFQTFICLFVAIAFSEVSINKK